MDFVISRFSISTPHPLDRPNPHGPAPWNRWDGAGTTNATRLQGWRWVLWQGSTRITRYTTVSFLSRGVAWEIRIASFTVTFQPWPCLLKIALADREITTIFGSGRFQESSLATPPLNTCLTSQQTWSTIDRQKIAVLNKSCPEPSLFWKWRTPQTSCTHSTLIVIISAHSGGSFLKLFPGGPCTARQGWPFLPLRWEAQQSMELRGTSSHEVPVYSGYHGGQLFCQPFQVDAEGQSIEVP